MTRRAWLLAAMMVVVAVERMGKRLRLRTLA
jgi:hypothetical protein